MKNLGKVKVIVGVLLVISILVLVICEWKYHTILWLFIEGVSEDYEAPQVAVIELLALVQSINLSIALYVLRILDKHLIPMY